MLVVSSLLRRLSARLSPSLPKFPGPKPVAALALIALASFIALTLFADAPGASAQAQPLATSTPASQADPVIPVPDSKPPRMGNLDSMLSQLVSRVEQGVSTANDAAADAPVSDGESVAVTFYTQGDATSLADFLSANGGDPRNVGEGYVEAYVPVSLLVSASERPGVTRVDAIVPPQSADSASLLLDSLDTQNAPARKGNVASQGVALHGATAWHNAGYTGAGVKVGIIQGGFRGFRALMGSELPTNVTARCYTGIGAFSSNLTNCETSSAFGTAIAETLLDIAPGVELYISNASGSRGDVKATVDWMVRQGVDVINYSMIWTWDGPGDGTSPRANSPLKSVDAAVRGGAVWASAAGNYARRTWYGQFTDADGNGWLNFVGNNQLNRLEIAAGETVRIQMRWDDSWTAANKDLDLYLVDIKDTSIVARSETYQTGKANDTPFEFLSYKPTASGTYAIAVRHWTGATPRWVQLQSWSRNYIERYTQRSIANPAESANTGMLAVCAAHYWDTNKIAEYSGRGPALDGRNKPDITGADCAQVASRSPYLVNGRQCWNDTTGVAAPQVAGLAALVKGAFPNYTPRQIASYLKTNAQARGSKPNNTWGHGFARLPAPPRAVVTPSPTPVRPAPTPVTGSGDLADVARELQRQTNLLQQVIQSLQSLIQTLTNR